MSISNHLITPSVPNTIVHGNIFFQLESRVSLLMLHKQFSSSVLSKAHPVAETDIIDVVVRLAAHVSFQLTGL